jgi:hypothetical protein
VSSEKRSGRSASESSPAKPEQLTNVREKARTAAKWFFGIVVGRIISKLLDVVF